MTAVATTDHQLTLQALRHAQNLAELQGIKQRHGETAVREAWKQLSDRERHALKAIADGHQLKHQNQLQQPQQSAAELPQQERQAEPATAQQDRAQSAPSERQPQDSLWGKSAEVAELEKQLEDVALDDSLSEAERDERQAELFEQWLAADADWERRLEAAAYAANCAEREADSIKQMRNDLKQRQASKENQAQRLKRYMLQALQKRGQQRVRGTFATVFQQRRSQIRPNCTAEELPEQFQRVTVEPRQSELSQAYKQAQQQGQDFPWAYETTETALTIRFK